MSIQNLKTVINIFHEVKFSNTLCTGAKAYSRGFMSRLPRQKNVLTLPLREFTLHQRKQCNVFLPDILFEPGYSCLPTHPEHTAFWGPTQQLLEHHL